MKLLTILLFFCILQVPAQNPGIKWRDLTEQGAASCLVVADSCIKQGFQVDSAHYFKGICFLKENKKKQTLKELDELRQTFPNFYLRHYLEGLYYFEQQNYGKAVDQFNAVLKHDSLHLKSLYNRALASGLLEDYAGAIQDLNICIKHEGHNAVYFYARAYWHELSGELTDAILDYEAGIKENSKSFESYIGLANCYRLQKNLTKACEVMDRAEAAGSQMALDIRQTYCK